MRSATGAVIVAVTLMGEPGAHAQSNPYRAMEHWAPASADRSWGDMSAVAVDRQDHVWILERCGANSCAGSSLSPILEFDAAGNLLRSFGAGLFVFPHGMHVDRDGNVWATDTQAKDGKGHVLFKFSPQGKLLLTLGTPGVPGNPPGSFDGPAAVVTTPSGDIFVADNDRVVKFSKDGMFVKTWGAKGSAPGEFNALHTIAVDSKGRIFVGDRGNNRIQIFDQDGTFLDEWKQFGRPTSIYIDVNDAIYVSDPQSNVKLNPGTPRGIRIGSAKDGTVTAFIPGPEPKTDDAATQGYEGIAADSKGNVYGVEVIGKLARKYVRQ